MPIYRVNGKTYNIPDDKIEGFEAKYPDATVEYHNEGKRYAIPLDKRVGYLSRYPNASYNPAPADKSQYTFTSEQLRLEPEEEQRGIVPMSGTSRPLGMYYDGKTDAMNYENNTRNESDNNKADTFAEGVAEGGKALGYGMQYTAGHLARNMGGTKQDYIDALGLISDVNADNYNADDARRAYEWKKYESDLKKWQKTKAERQTYRENRPYRGQFIDNIKHWWNDPAKPVAPNDNMDSEELMRLNRVFNVIGEALEEAGGDKERAKEILLERSKKETWGDRQSRKAIENLATVRPTEGTAAYIGNLVPQMVGNVAAIGAAAFPYTRPLSKWLGMANMAALTAASAGSSGAEAEKAGATNKEIGQAMLASGVVELGTEYLPYSRYIGRIGRMIDDAGADILKKSVKENPTAKKELKSLLKNAKGQVKGGLNAKNVGEYLKDVGTEGISEFLAEFSQTFVPMIYEEPEKYPTLVEALNNGVEGAKGGLLMGMFLGLGSGVVANRAHKERRKQQGSVLLAETKDGIVEVVGGDNNSVEVMNAAGERYILPSNDIISATRYSYNEWNKGVENELRAELQRQYENGQTTTDKHGLRVTFEAAADAVEGVIPLDIDDIVAYDAADRYEEQGDADTATAIRAFLSARAAHSGMTADIVGQARRELEAATAEIDAIANKKDGNIYSVTLGGGSKGYVTGGTIVTDEQGNIDENATREANEGGYLYIMQEGRVRTLVPEALVSLDNVESGEQAKAMREAEINASFNARYEELTAPVPEAAPAPQTPAQEVATAEALPTQTAAAPTAQAAPTASNEAAEDAARALGLSVDELNDAVKSEQKGLSIAAKFEAGGDTDGANAIRAYVTERFGTNAAPVSAENGNNAPENITQAPENVAPALSPEQQRKAKRAEIAARIPTKGKNKLWTQAKAEDVAEYIATLTDDAAVQQATADKYIADIKEKQAKMDAIEALELNDDIAFWESVKGLLAPVETQTKVGATEQAPEAIPAPTAENEMQPVAEVAQQPMTEVQSEDAPAQAGELVGETEELNQSEDNLEMGARSANEASKEKTIGRSLSEQEAQSLIVEMENNAEVAPDIELNIDNWDALFGEDGTVNTLIGEVKMGENQFTKLMRQDRNGKLGMIKPTLENPDAIIEDKSKAKEGDKTERASSYIFVKAFKKADGTRYYYFTSVTVSKDSKEVVISNQEKRRNAIANLLVNGKLVWKHADNVSSASDVANGLYSSQVDSSELATEGTDAPQTNGTINADVPSSEGESTTQSANSQENSVKSGENTQNSGEKDVIEEMREQNRVAEERQQRAGVPPRPSDYSSAINAEDTEAQKAWEDKFNDFLAKLTIDDLPTIDSTISSMQDNKEAIKAGDPGGYKENPHYKAFDYIEKALKRRKRELEESSTNGEKSQEIEDYSTNGSEETAPNASQQGEPADIEINDETRADKAAEEAVLKYYSPEPINTATATSKQMSSDGTFDIFQFDDLVEFAEEIGAVSPIKIEPKIMGGKMMTIASVAERGAINLEAAYRSGNRKKIERVEKEQSLLSDSLAEVQTIKDIEGTISYYKRKKEEYKDKPTAYRAFEFLENLSKKVLAKKKAELQRGSLSLDGDNPAFRAATEKTMQALENTGVEVVMATEEQVKEMMGADFSRAAAPFYSNARKAVLDIKQEKATPEQWVAMLKKNGGLKAGEDAWVGLEAWLGEQQGAVTKQEILDYLAEHSIQIEEVKYSQFGYGLMDEAARNIEAEVKVIGWDAVQEKYPGVEDFFEFDNGEILWSEEKADVGEYEDFIIDNGLVDVNPAANGINETRERYTTEGLERKREIALTVPTIEPYNASDEVHFGDAGGGRAVAWVRFGETTDSEGKRVLVIDEIQSKRHQDGREKGYKTNEEYEFIEDGVITELRYNGRSYFFESSMPRDSMLGSVRYEADITNKDGVPSAPFEKNWHELAMKRMLRLAAEEGFDKVAWTTGEQQARRYDMSRQVESISVEENTTEEFSDGTPVAKNIIISTANGMDIRIDADAEGVIHGGEYGGKHLSDVVGKEIAEKIMQPDSFKLEGDGLRIGGEGMKGFYDKMLPSFVQKYTKKWGAKVGEVTMPALKENNTMHSVDVTPEMREGVMQGQPMFLRTSDGTVYGWTVSGKIFLTPEGVNPNTPVHEYTHLWASAIEQRDPELWAEVVEAMKLSPVWAEVMADEAYRDIWNDENRTASEVLSRLTGNENYRRTMQEAALKESDPTRKFSLIAAWGRVKRVLAKFWNRVREMLDLPVTGEPGNDVPAWERFVNSAIGDFYGGVNPNVENSPMERMTMGSRVDARMAQVASELEGRELTTEQQAVADVFGGKADNLTIYVKTRDGNERKVVMRQGNEANAGAKHSLYRHFGTGVGVITSDDIISIPNVIANGVRTEKRRGITRLAEYKLTDVNGGEFTVLTEIKKGKEIFNDFYSNKKAPLSGTFNTQSAHTANNNALSANKGNTNSSNTQNNNSKTLFRSVGGNSGYVGYSMSKRAAEAREEGRYPKTDFKKVYDVPQQTLEALVEAGIIDNSEWHHTSKMGNRTTFYGWAEEDFAERYARNKKEIDKLVKEVNANIAEIEKEQRAFLESWKGYGYPETFDWDAYSRRARELEELPYNERKDILHSEFPETAEADKDDRRRSEFSDKFYKKKREQKKRLQDLLEEKVIGNEGRVDDDITSAVNALAEKLHLEVEVVTDVSSLEGKKRRAKGFYAKSTGKITIVIPNHSSVFDVEQTLLHEAVAHYGLRQLFGEHFDTFLDNVFKNADVSIRQRILEIAQKKNWDLRTATEEYLASLAENTEFENTSASWWRQIKDFFLNMLHKIGFEDFGGVTLTDNELRYILWRSYENLAEPGKHRSILGEVSDIAKQYELKVGNYATNTNAAENDALFRDGDPEIHERALARDRYERRVKTGMFQSQEALQDSMLGLKEAMQAILGQGTYIEDVDGFENAYLGENRLSSVNKAEADAFAHTLFKPMLDEVAKLARTEAEREELTDYMMAKHGLERNRVMAERDAKDYVDSEIKKLKKELNRKGITEEEIKKVNKKINLLNAKLDGVEKNFSEHDARIWYETRRNTIDTLWANGEIDETEYKKRINRLNKIYKEGYIGLNRGNDYAGLTALTAMDDVADAEAEAQRIVDDYEQAHDTTDLWEKVNAVSKAILQKSYECGMMSKETFDKVSNMYEYYIPLRGFDEKTSNEAYAYLTHKDSAFNAPIKKAKGRKSKADDPFANLQSMAESAIMQGNRNKLVKQRFLNFALNHPSDLVSVSDIWVEYDDVTDEWKPVFPDNIESTDTPEKVEQKMQDFETKMEALAENNPDKYKKGKDAVGIPYRVVESRDMREHQIIVKRGGRDYVITINGNPRAAQAINGLTNPDNEMVGAIGAILRTGEKINRLLSAAYTTRNPDFIISNFMRDMLYSNSMVWIKENPNYALRFHLNSLIVNPFTMKRLLAKYRKGTLDMSDKTEAMFHQFMMNGGETGYTNIRDIEQHKNDIRKEIKQANGKLKLARAWSWLWERLDELNRAIENCARFAAFVTSREMGRSIDRSIYDAKEISVNFNKKGSGAKFYDSVGQTTAGNASAMVSGLGRSGFVFWNAAIQGTTNFGRQIKRHPVKTVTGMATMFLLGAIVAYLGGDDDEDDKNAYYNLPEYVRRSNILFRVGDSWISIPLPIEYRAIYGMGELMTSVLSGKEHLTGGEIAEAVLGQATQILPIDFLEGGGGLNAFVPSVVKPLWEAYIAKKSWTGLPLYKDNPYNKNMSEWTKAYKSANKYIVNLAAVLNEATGGDAYTKGAIDINPAQIEYMLNGYFGGVASTIDKLSKMYETAVERYERLNSQNYADNGNNSSASNRGNNVRLGNYLLQKGRYYDRPNLYVKTQRADRFGIKDDYSREGDGTYTDEEINSANVPVSKALGKPRGTRKQAGSLQRVSASEW